MTEESDTLALSDAVHFKVVYDGPALEDHTMDAHDLGAALMAISDLCASARTAATGTDEGQVQIRVKATNSSSFEIDLCLLYAQAMRIGEDVLTAVGLAELIGLIGGAGVLKYLRWKAGREIVSQQQDGNQIRVQVKGDRNNVTFVDKRVIAVSQDAGARSNLAKVLRPLETEGVEFFKVDPDTEDGLTIARGEVLDGYYELVASELSEVPVAEPQEIEAVLALRTISFAENLQWQFFYGDARINARIDDEPFLQRAVKGDMRFGAHDHLRVRLAISQTWKKDGSLRTEYRVTKVLEHIPAPKQMRLESPDDSGGSSEDPAE